MSNVLVITDTHNLGTSLRKKFGDTCKLDYQKYLSKAVGDDIQFRAIAYGVQVEDSAKKFINFLRIQSFETVFISLFKKEEKTFYVSNTCRIVIDILNMVASNKVDVVVFGSTDPQYVPLIEEVKSKGVEFRVLACKIPKALRDVASSFEEISEELLLNNTSSDSI